METNNVNSLRLIDRDTFVAAITEDKADSFSKTFRAKADMGGYWDRCWGLFEGDDLMGAIIVTMSVRKPHVANLQLLHTFATHRRKGVARQLTEHSIQTAKDWGADYFRVSCEPDAVPFYESVGFEMLGRQKSGAQLSMFRVHDHAFDVNDSVISAAVHKKGKGGCVEVFKSSSSLEKYFISD